MLVSVYGCQKWIGILFSDHIRALQSSKDPSAAVIFCKKKIREIVMGYWIRIGVISHFPNFLSPSIFEINSWNCCVQFYLVSFPEFSNSYWFWKSGSGLGNKNMHSIIINYKFVDVLQGMSNIFDGAIQRDLVRSVAIESVSIITWFGHFFFLFRQKDWCSLFSRSCWKKENEDDLAFAN